LCVEYGRTSGKKVLLLVDATFAPGSEVLQKLRDIAADLNVMVFMSLSKSVSRGLTTAGAIVANHTEDAKDLLRGVSGACEMFDSWPRPTR